MTEKGIALQLFVQGRNRGARSKGRASRRIEEEGSITLYFLSSIKAKYDTDVLEI
jgi:hypothetical protein